MTAPPVSLTSISQLRSNWPKPVCATEIRQQKEQALNISNRIFE